MEACFRNSLGNIPIPEIFDHEGETYVCLNYTARNVPAGISNFRSTRNYPKTYGRAGVLLEFEWTKDSLWYDENHFWAGFIPTDSADAWDRYIDLSDPVETVLVPEKEVYTIPSVWAHHARNEIIGLQRCCLDIRYHTSYGKRSLLPYFVDFKLFTREYPSESDVDIVTAAVKRCILDGRGFLAWWMLSVHNWTEQLPIETVELMGEMGLLDRARRGVIVDLARDWKTVNISNLIAHDVPVFYPWAELEASDSRFTRFNPSFLRYYNEFVASTIDLDEACAEDVPGLLTLYPSLLQYDEFCQSVHQTWDTTASDRRIATRTYHVFIEDFEGWKPREILSPTEAELTVKRYHHRLFNGPPERKIICWAFRPISRASPDGDGCSVSEDDVTPSQIREMYRGRYAPLSGQTFDVETGKESQSPVTPSLATRLSEVTVTDKVRTDDSNAMIVDDQASTASGPSTSPEDRARPYESHATKRGRRRARRPKPYGTSRPTNLPLISPEFRRFEANVNDEHNTSSWVASMAGPANSNGLSLAERLGYQARSNASSRASEERIAVHAAEEIRAIRLEEGRETLEHRLTDWRRKFIVPGTPSEVCAVPTSCRWNPTLLEKGTLVIPDLRVAVMMRLIANTTEGCTSIREVLTLAIERGFEFQIYVKQSDVALFRPALLSPMDYAASVYYSIGFHTPALTWGSGGQDLYNRYRAGVMDVLRRPHARAFIGLGGPISWIARRYGGVDLVRQFMNGPSIQVTVHQKGKVNLKNFNFAQTDDVSPEEIQVLLGYVKYGSQELDKWVYPTPHILLSFLHHYHGDWNPATEHLVFDAIYEHLEKGRVEPMTESGWHDFLRWANKGRNAPEYMPTASDFSSANAELLKSYGKGWHQVALKDLVVPEVLAPVATGN